MTLIRPADFFDFAPSYPGSAWVCLVVVALPHPGVAFPGRAWELVVRHTDFAGSGVRHARAGGHLGRTRSGLSLSCLDSRVRGNDAATVSPSFSLWGTTRLLTLEFDQVLLRCLSHFTSCSPAVLLVLGRRHRRGSTPGAGT